MLVVVCGCRLAVQGPMVSNYHAAMQGLGAGLFWVNLCSYLHHSDRLVREDLPLGPAPVTALPPNTDSCLALGLGRPISAWQYTIVLVMQRSVPRVCKVLVQVVPMFVGYALFGVMLFGCFFPRFGDFSMAFSTLFCLWNGQSTSQATKQSKTQDTDRICRPC